jgi:hypothetical protein
MKTQPRFKRLRRQPCVRGPCCVARYRKMQQVTCCSLQPHRSPARLKAPLQVSMLDAHEPFQRVISTASCLGRKRMPTVDINDAFIEATVCTVSRSKCGNLHANGMQ